MYVRIVSWLTLPAVLRKNERVQSDGSLHRGGETRRASHARYGPC